MVVWGELEKDQLLPDLCFLSPMLISYLYNLLKIFVMKKLKLLYVLIILTSTSYARPVIDYFDLLGSWSSENDRWGTITLEFRGFNNLITDKLLIYHIDGYRGAKGGKILNGGYYGYYTLKVTSGTGMLIYSGLWVSNDSFKGIFLAKEASLEEFKVNSDYSKVLRSYSYENMKAYIRLEKEIDTDKLVIIWKDLDYYLHHQRVFFSGGNYRNIEQLYRTTAANVSVNQKENSPRLIFRKTEL